MGFRITSIIRRASFSRTQGSTKGLEVPKGYLAVYVGHKMRRFVIPVSYLNQSLFQELLNEAEEEFGFDHPMGGLTIPYISFSTNPITKKKKTMGFRITSIIRRASFSATQGSTKGLEVPKGYVAVYVGDKMRRFVIPVSYLNQPLFQELLNQAEEEFGYDHPMGGLTIPCSEDEFLTLTSRLN
ncbi:auxin-responsive protein SAUR68-like [Vicia villosa]|uniref:auxin-responsive protein SAUR68-like n=1 Tax=Vicia villosa TaxID=3911 RepID=UPI00273B42CD|nr:auxin-responsive protein SAUR68-like [Vicia villosa]